VTATARQSTVVDNTSNLFTDALLSVRLKTGTTTANTYIQVYVFATVSGGTRYTGGAGATDAAYTMVAQSPLIPIGRIGVPDTTARTYDAGPWSVAACFGGSLPDHWGVVIDNESGANLDSTAGNHVVEYQGVFGAYT
jgi:hypothetical protein